MARQLLGDMAIKDLSPKDTNIGHRLIKNMRICGSGIYKYAASEAELLGLAPIPQEFKDLSVINVYRPPEVLNANKDLFARIPIITGHHVLVDDSNAKQLAVGMVGDSVTSEVSKEDGETYLYTTGTIIAGDGIKAYEDYGQLSVGYVPTMKWKRGTHNGEEYQAELTGFECVNHLLICKVARGGPQCMVMDSLDDSSPLERFILKNEGGEDMGIFAKIFGSTKPQTMAGDSAVVSALLQSISAGADPKIQVKKVREFIGDSKDSTFDEYLGELEMAGDEKPEVVAKAVDIVDNYYKEHCAGDGEKTVIVKKDEDKKDVEVKENDKDVEVKKDEDKEVKETGDAQSCGTQSCGDAIDYEKLASMVAEKLKPAAKKEEVTGDELSMPIAGDASSNAKDSSQFLTDIFGGKA